MAEFASADFKTTKACAPLVVDLDGTLVPVDLFYETVIQLLSVKPWLVFLVPFWLRRGKAALKQAVAERVDFDPAILPYSEPFVDWLRMQKAAGRTIWLVTGSDIRLAQAVAAHLGLFDAVHASDGTRNLTGATKATHLVRCFGAQGFVYAANDKIDLAIWRSAQGAVLVNTSTGVDQSVRQITKVEAQFPARQQGTSAWLRAMRPHQWVKNTLVFVPLVVSHQLLDLASAAISALLFVAFCLCASSVYLLNDLMDLASDRRHRTKRLRPLAAGLVQALPAAGFATALLIVAAAIAVSLGPLAMIGLSLYYGLTLLYSWNLKRRMVIDVFTLAALYMIRVIVGGAVIWTPISHWLLAFSGFVFLSLGFAKRYIELQRASIRADAAAHGRSYVANDADMVGMFGVASGFAAILILSLYLNSEVVSRIYQTPVILWLWVPAVLYWLCRIWLIAHRGHLNDDPVAFAVRDPITYALVAFVLVVLLAALRLDIPALSDIFLTVHARQI